MSKIFPCLAMIVFFTACSRLDQQMPAANKSSGFVAEDSVSDKVPVLAILAHASLFVL